MDSGVGVVGVGVGVGWFLYVFYVNENWIEFRLLKISGIVILSQIICCLVRVVKLLFNSIYLNFHIW